MILNHCEQGSDWPYDLNIPGDTQELCGLLKCIKLGVWTESWNFFFFFFINSGKALLGSLLQRAEGKSQNKQVPLLAHSPRGVVSCFLKEGEGRGVSRGQAGGVLRSFAHPCGSLVWKEHVQYLAFAPDTMFLLQVLPKWPLGFSLSWYLLLLIFPNCTGMRLFLVP